VNRTEGINVIKRIATSLAVLAAVALGPIAITATAGASPTLSDGPPAGAVIVNNNSYTIANNLDPAYTACVTNAPDYTTIQAAVNAEDVALIPAPIYVCPGTYTGDVDIHANISLYGAQWDTSGPDQSLLAPSTSLTGSLIYFPGAGGGTAEGFTLEGSTWGPEIWAPGAGDGWLFLDNVIAADGGGIYFNTDGSSAGTTSIQDNLFIQNAPYNSADGFSGTAIDFLAQPANRVDIEDNTFQRLSGVSGDINTTGSGACTGQTSDPNSSTGLDISFNSYDQDPPLTGHVGNSFVNLVCTTDAIISENSITLEDSSDVDAVSPIYLGGGDITPTVEDNTELGSGGGAFFASGVEFNSDSYPVDSPQITNNVISGFGEGVLGYGGSGHHYTAPSGFLISDNAISEGIVGVDIENIDGAPSAGTVTENTMSSNFLYDCADASSGSGTDGTANTWTLNDASTSNPAGLCATNTVTPGAPPVNAVAGGSTYTANAAATSLDTTDPTTTAGPLIAVTLDSASTGCTLSGVVVGFTGTGGTCILDFADPGNGIYGPAFASLSFPVGPNTSGGGGSGAAPAGSVNDVVVFNSEGGTSEPTLSGANGTSVTLPTPTLTGYTFLGWFTASAGGTLVSSPYTLSAPSTTLYAQWESNSATPASAAFHYAYTIHTFVFGSSALTNQIKSQIDHLVILFNAHHVVHFTLRGNATLPNNASNQALAKARALAVDGYMKTLGIHASTTISSTVSGSTYDYSYLVVYVATS
jgi:uncharacterized repeat protein (TIGR02543 family)